MSGFNEAGAINPGKPERLAGEARRQNVASMRPGQLTPENGPGSSGFLCRFGSFNEAGAINPGKRLQAAASYYNVDDASMRPGQLTPENG